MEEIDDTPKAFVEELEYLLNKYSSDNIGTTKDSIMADYIETCLWALREAQIKTGKSDELITDIANIFYKK